MPQRWIQRHHNSPMAAFVFLCAFVIVMLIVSEAFATEVWQQFRGHRNSGVSQSSEPLPVEVAPEPMVIWKTKVAGGHSSPVLSHDRIYLTTADDDKLSTVALVRATGTFLWEALAPHEALENIHKSGSRAQSSPVTDGDVVISFFGSSGLLAYDKSGKLLWSHRMGPFKNDFGAGSSPIIEGDLVIVVQDHDVGSFIAAYNKRTGDEDSHLSKAEYQIVVRTHTDGKNVLLAIAPGGQGDITRTHVRWEQTKPETFRQGSNRRPATCGNVLSGWWPRGRHGIRIGTDGVSGSTQLLRQLGRVGQC